MSTYGNSYHWFSWLLEENSQNYAVWRKPSDTISGFVEFTSLRKSVFSSSASEETLKYLYLARNAQEACFRLIQNLINISQR